MAMHRGYGGEGAQAPYYDEQAAVDDDMTVSLTVPEGATVGSKLTCTAPDGQELRLTVPEGVPAGSTMILTFDPTTKAWRCMAEPAPADEFPEEDAGYSEQLPVQPLPSRQPQTQVPAARQPERQPMATPQRQTPCAPTRNHYTPEKPVGSESSTKARVISGTATVTTSKAVVDPRPVNLSYVPLTGNTFPASHVVTTRILPLTTRNPHPFPVIPGNSSYTPPPQIIQGQSSYTPPPLQVLQGNSFTPLPGMPTIGGYAAPSVVVMQGQGSYTPPPLQVMCDQQRPSFSPLPQVIVPGQHQRPSYTPPPGAVITQDRPSYTAPPLMVAAGGNSSFTPLPVMAGIGGAPAMPSVPAMPSGPIIGGVPPPGVMYGGAGPSSPFGSRAPQYVPQGAAGLVVTAPILPAGASMGQAFGPQLSAGAMHTVSIQHAPTSTYAGPGPVPVQQMPGVPGMQMAQGMPGMQMVQGVPGGFVAPGGLNFVGLTPPQPLKVGDLPQLPDLGNFGLPFGVPGFGPPTPGQFGPGPAPGAPGGH